MKEIISNKGKIIRVDDSDFEWLNQWGWHITAAGYARKRNGYKHVFLHCLLIECPKGFVRDHKDRDRLNNQRDNLRIISRSQNCQNRGLRVSGTSKYKGVSKKQVMRGGTLVTRWISDIMVNGKRQPTKSFKTEIEAAAHYNEMAKKLHGKFAVLNRL